MYFNPYGYMQTGSLQYYPSQMNHYVQQPHFMYPLNYAMYSTNPFFGVRQSPIQGQATWTDGGQVTQCEIPWSHNGYMTVAVGENAPYQCGQTLQIRNLSSPEQQQITVTVVDQVVGYEPNKVNLHRRAFEALGADPNEGIINVEIIPVEEQTQQTAWGPYLLGLVQSGYPGYNVLNVQAVEKTQVSPEQVQEIYQFQLQSPQEQITVQGSIVYHPSTNRIISFDIKEV